MPSTGRPTGGGGIVLAPIIPQFPVTAVVLRSGQVVTQRTGEIVVDQRP